jgi:hypothetical protein
VGLNRPFKHAVKVAYHSWLVDTLLHQCRKGEKLDLDPGLLGSSPSSIQVNRAKSITR